MNKTRLFYTQSGKKISDLAKYIREYMEKDNTAQYEIYVGCDSQVNRIYTIYSVAVGIRRVTDGVGRGVHVIHTREKERKYDESRGGIFTRLWKEVEKLAEVSEYLRDNGFDVTEFEAHVDANENEKFASNMIKDSAIGYLRGRGFNVQIKPNAFAATYAANRYAR